ncbi:MAG TPA: acetylxylan esterase, partial [Terriglobia bacterium]|nr:acetylxylan esterase [Terriglobia bacterium]
MTKIAHIAWVIPFALLAALSAAQDGEFNYDESKVVSYTLPDSLLGADGTRVTTARDWNTKRRKEILRLFENDVYGRTPTRRVPMRFRVTESSPNALNGLATRKQISIATSEGPEGPRIDLLLYIPNGTTKPVPAFLGLNFNGNHSVHSDTSIAITQSWMRNNPELGIV